MNYSIFSASGAQTRTPTNGATEQLRHPSASAFAARAPVANMTSTPSQRQAIHEQTPISDRRSSRKNKRKQANDYQAEADAEEKARDLADFDWRPTQDTETAEVPRKKKQKSSSTLRQSSAVEAQPMSGSNYNLYDNVKAKTQRERDLYISKIKRNWGEPDVWMPRSIWPSTSRKIEETLDDGQYLEDPKDWSAPLLKQLSHLSSITVGEPMKAYEALEEAVLARSDGVRMTPILTSDVKIVIEQIEQSKAKFTVPRTPPFEPASEAMDSSSTQLPEQTTAVADQDDPGSQLRTPPRSSTIEPDIPIKQEFLSARTTIHPRSPEAGPQDRVPDSTGVHVSSEKAWDTARTKRKLQIEDEELKIKDQRLQTRDERLEIQEKRLKIQQQMLALKSSD